MNRSIIGIWLMVFVSAIGMASDTALEGVCMTNSSADTGQVYVPRHSTTLETGAYFTETYPQPVLTNAAKQAIKASPGWIQESLAIAFSSLKDTEQDLFAEKILNVAVPEHRDEIAFCIAHIPLSTLTHHKFDAGLLDENVAWIYLLDEHLKYVRLVEYGDPGQGGTDYYTTAAYIIDEGDGPFELEIPRDIYYWWVVYPAVTEERPGYVNPETSEIVSAEEGFFWRQYFWESDSVYDYRTNGDWICTLFADVAYLPSFLWDRQAQTLPAGREFTDGCSAVDIVSNWVLDVMHWGATPPRPNQPVALAYDHDGNCGEYQDLLGAALRTALIPTNGVLTIVDDHVWNEFWDQGWRPIGDSDHTNLGNYSNGADYTYDGWKDISAAYALRGDKLEINRTADYTDSCVMTTTVTDSAGNPVDGALVRIHGQSYYNPKNYGVCITGVTDVNGQLTLDLGDNRNFKGEVYSSIGNAPLKMIVENTEAGASYEYNVVLPGLMDVLHVTNLGTPPEHNPKWRLSASIDVPSAILYGVTRPPTGGDLQRTFQTEITPGSVDVFLVDTVQKTAWEADKPFNAYQVIRETSSYDKTMILNDNIWTLVISNRHHNGHREMVDINLTLEKISGNSWIEVDTISRQVSLEPGEIYTASFSGDEFTMTFEMPGQQFREGDTVYLNLLLVNPTAIAVDADLYVLMEVYGEFFAYPTWANVIEGLPKTEISVPAGSVDSKSLIPTFTMPAVTNAGPFYFYCAAFEPNTLAVETLIGNVDMWEFALTD
ncbi:MAG: transglutaminase domain-containing protein [bacterium]